MRANVFALVCQRGMRAIAIALVCWRGMRGQAWPLVCSAGVRSLGALAHSPGRSVPSLPRGWVGRVVGRVAGRCGVAYVCGCAPPAPLTPQPPSPYIITLKSPRRGYFKPKMPYFCLFLPQNCPKFAIFGPKNAKSSYFCPKSTKIVLFWSKIH